MQWSDRDMGTLPRRFPAWIWAGCIGTLLVVYGFMFTFVHPHADARACGFHLPDPLFDLIPWDRWWHVITRDAFVIAQISALVALLGQALVGGDHRPLLRWVLGVALTGVQRAATILLIPACKITKAVGVPVLTNPPVIDLGFVQVPVLLFADNDLIFSGHVAEFFILWRVTRSWPRAARLALLVFQVLQIYGLIATRGHYSVDILLAFPCAYLGDRIGLRILGAAAK